MADACDQPIALAEPGSYRIHFANLALKRLCDDLGVSTEGFVVELAQRAPEGLARVAPVEGLIALILPRGPEPVTACPAPIDEPDPVTGVGDRATLDRWLESQFATRQTRPYAVLFVDLDGFKQINDTLGHVAGDLALAEVGRRLLRAVRAQDRVGRYGGDEFLILAEGVETEAEALRIVSRVNEVLASPFEMAGGAWSLSASTGWALSNAGHADATQLVVAADRSMYEAKRLRPDAR